VCEWRVAGATLMAVVREPQGRTAKVDDRAKVLCVCALTYRPSHAVAGAPRPPGAGGVGGSHEFL